MAYNWNAPHAGKRHANPAAFACADRATGQTSVSLNDRWYYMLASTIAEAFIYSVRFTALALIIFGGIKGHFTGINKAKSTGQTLLVGGLAAAAAYGLAHACGH